MLHDGLRRMESLLAKRHRGEGLSRLASRQPIDERGEQALDGPQPPSVAC